MKIEDLTGNDKKIAMDLYEYSSIPGIEHSIKEGDYYEYYEIYGISEEDCEKIHWIVLEQMKGE